jgi:hypothetical protein
VQAPEHHPTRGRSHKYGIVQRNSGAAGEFTYSQTRAARVLFRARSNFRDGLRRCALIGPYERRVYVAAASVLQNEADADEVGQEAFLKAFVQLYSFRRESKFSTWLIQIASDLFVVRRASALEYARNG